MTGMAIGFLTAIGLVMLASGMLRRGAPYEYPFLAGATLFGFILPQLPGLALDPYLADGAVTKTALFAAPCMLALMAGWRIGRSAPLRALDWTFEERALLVAAALMSLIGAFFYWMITRLPPELTEATLWSGPGTIYIFFAKTLTYGLAVAVLCMVRRPSWAAAAIIGFCLIFILDRVVLHGRRAEAVDLVMILLLALWFQRRVAIARPLMLALVVAGALAVNSTGDYRSLARSSDGPRWEQLTEIDAVGNFRRLMETGGEEMRNAAAMVDHIAHTHEFDYGIFHWNEIVFGFVPAQIVGRGVKEALYLPPPSPYPHNYVPLTGTTWTGFADAFRSFWYFGALKFFLIALVLGRIFAAAMRGSTLWQIVAMLSAGPAMHVITHHTQFLPTAWLHMTLFLIPFLALARTHPRRARHDVQEAACPV